VGLRTDELALGHDFSQSSLDVRAKVGLRAELPG
jgi:hypothetical protein